MIIQDFSVVRFSDFVLYWTDTDTDTEYQNDTPLISVAVSVRPVGAETVPPCCSSALQKAFPVHHQPLPNSLNLLFRRHPFVTLSLIKDEGLCRVVS